MQGPSPKPNLSCMRWYHKFHYFGIMKNSFLLTKNQKKRLFENWSGIKIVREKIDFWNLFENWNLEN